MATEVASKLVSSYTVQVLLLHILARAHLQITMQPKGFVNKSQMEEEPSLRRSFPF